MFRFPASLSNGFTSLRAPVVLAAALLACPACESEEQNKRGDQDQQEEELVDTGAPLVQEECGEPQQLYNLDELMEALRAGKDVRVSLFYGHCTLDGYAVIEASGGMTVETYEWFGAGAIGNDQAYVAFSKSSLVLMYDEHYNDYVKVRIYDDGTVDVIAEYLNPQTYEVDMYEEFDCDLDMGDGGAVTMFTR